MYFKASQSFIDRFKIRYGIISRKVQNLVNNKHLNDKEILESEARNLRSEITNKVPNFDLNLIVNSDQTAFNYETVTKRTFSFKVEKTFLKVQSKSAGTHSFTLQPTISYSGKYFKKLDLPQ